MKAKKSAARLSLGVAMRRRRLAEATSAFCGTADIAGLTIGSTRSRMTLIGLIDRFGPSVLTLVGKRHWKLTAATLHPTAGC